MKRKSSNLEIQQSRFLDFPDPYLDCLISGLLDCFIKYPSLHSLTMKRILLALSTLLLLTACRSTALEYELAFDVQDQARQTVLAAASLRVIERRLANIGEEPLDIDIETKDGRVRLIVKLEEETVADILNDHLTEPFELLIMRQTKTEEDADIVVEGHGGFQETGLTEEHIKWLEASEDEGGKGRVTISFTEAGRTLMAELFAENKGKYIGLFVRERLISKLLVDTDELKDDIIISDIPTVKLARVFADDVNVGLHVTFTPVE